MSLEWSIAALLALTLGNYWLRRSVLYPPFLFCSIWLLAAVLSWFNFVETDSVHPSTLAIITAGAALFSAGGLLAFLVPKVWIETRLILTRFPERNKVFKPLLILFLLFGISRQVQDFRIIAAQGQGGSIFERARNAGITAQRNGEGFEGLSTGSIYFVSWTVFTTIIFFLKGRDKSFWLLTCIALVSVILTTGRTSILQLFAGLICAHLMTTRRLRFLAAIRVARLPILLFLFLFIGLVFVNKTEQSQFYGSGIASVAGAFFVSYIVGPLAAFDAFLQNPGNTALVPNHTFKFYLGILAHLHVINYAPAPMLQEFVGVPYPVNVYTMYKDYVIDFGISGALGAVTIIGFFHTLLYRKALTGSFLANFLFALSIFPVAMAIFSDQYSSLGNYTNAMLFGAIFIVFQSLPIRFLPRIRTGYGFPHEVEAPVA